MFGSVSTDSKHVAPPHVTSVAAVRAPSPPPVREASPPPQPASSHASSVPEADAVSGKRACDNYMVDLAAAGFNVCKCGFKKTEHARQTGTIGQLHIPAAAPAAPAPSRAPVVIERSAAPAAAAAATLGGGGGDDDDEGGACDDYRVDLSAAFGTCKCGYKKSEHKMRAAAAYRPPPKAAAASEPSKTKAAPAQFGAKARAMRLATTSETNSRAPPSFATVGHASEPAKAAAEPPVRASSPPPPPQQQAASAPAAEEAEPVAAAAEQPAEEAEPVAAAAEQPAEEATGEYPKALDPPELYVASYDFAGQAEEDLVFAAGDVIEVLELLDENWLLGRKQGSEFKGVFPVGYATKADDADGTTAAAAHHEEEEDDDGAAAAAAAAAQREQEEEHRRAQEEEEAQRRAQQQREAEEEEAQRRAQEEQEEARRRAQEEEEAATAAATAEPEVAAAPSGASSFTATALYDYQGSSPEDLSFSAGDVITVTDVIDAEWWHGTTSSGSEGIFPCSYVERSDGAAAPHDDDAGAAAHDEPPPPPPAAAEEAAEEEPVAAPTAGAVTCNAMYDFEAQAEDDLAFAQGDVITVVEVIDKDWLRGELNGREGLVPRGYVDLVDA